MSLYQDHLSIVGAATHGTYLVSLLIDIDQYTIAVKAGILNDGYSRNQFDLCPQKLLTFDDVDQEKHVSFCTAVTAQSTAGGQGFVKCNCGLRRS